MKREGLVGALFAFLLLAIPSLSLSQTEESALFPPLEWRTVGPDRGGRSPNAFRCQGSPRNGARLVVQTVREDPLDDVPAALASHLDGAQRVAADRDTKTSRGHAANLSALGRERATLVPGRGLVEVIPRLGD